MTTFKSCILNYKKPDGKTNIKIRLTHNRKVSYIATDMFVAPKNFNKKTGFVRSDELKDVLNRNITLLIADLTEKYFSIKNRQILTAEQVKKRLLMDNQGQIDFIAFSNSIIKETSNKNTASWYKVAISVLQKFKSKVYITDINVRFLQDFEKFLYDKGTRNGINNYMRGIRSLFNKAIDRYNDEDLGIIKIPHYPFRKYKIKPVTIDTQYNCLSVEQLQKFSSYNPSHFRDEMAQDIFMLMIYLIGINAIDLYNLDFIKKGRINYQRSKTGKMISIKVEPEVKHIIKKYEGTKKALYFYRKYADEKNFARAINKGLERISRHLGFERKVTTNWARHTWATIARNDCGISKDDVALSLGHSDPHRSVTDVYLKPDYSLVDKANRKVIDRINKKSNLHSVHNLP